MKHSLALILACCALVAQDKPAAEAPKPAAAEKPAEAKLKIQPINVRDELVVEIHALKEQIASCRGKLVINRSYMSDQAIQPSANNSFFDQAKAQNESNITLLVESQRALVLALAELAKLPAESPTAYHSSSPPPRRNPPRNGR
jgi:hypothetical protein